MWECIWSCCANPIDLHSCRFLFIWFWCFWCFYLRLLSSNNILCYGSNNRWYTIFQLKNLSLHISTTIHDTLNFYSRRCRLLASMYVYGQKVFSIWIWIFTVITIIIIIIYGCMFCGHCSIHAFLFNFLQSFFFFSFSLLTYIIYGNNNAC